MARDIKQSLILIAVFNNFFTPINAQLALPMYMPAAMPVYAVPAPVAVPFAVAIPLPERKTTTTTTTTSQPPNFAIAMPVPAPVAVPFAIPIQPPTVFCQGKPRPQNCPPCPPCICIPSCTPAFFSYCSTCHQKCRCRNPADPLLPLSPVPGPPHPIPVSMLPAPVIGPPPVVVVPIPPIIKNPVISSSSSDDTSDSCDDGNRRNLQSRSGRKVKRILSRNYRRNRKHESDESEIDKVKPVLSYVSENGEVKFETKISDKDAIELLNEGKFKMSSEKQTLNIETDANSRVFHGSNKSGRRYSKILLRDSPTNHVLNKGKNNFLFKPPTNKKIDNVAVSFQVS